MTEKLDKTDILILKALQENGRITVKDLALKVHLSTTPVFERMHRLEDEGYIQRYTAVLSPSRLGRGFIVYCSVRLRRMGRDIANDFISRVKDIPEVAECYNISGDFDFLLHVVTASTSTLTGVLEDIKRIPGVSKTRTHLVLRTDKNILSPLPEATK